MKQDPSETPEEAPQRPMGSGKGDARLELTRVAGVLATVWALGGWLGWTFQLPTALHVALLPVCITTWPATQCALALEGHGFGANVRPGAVPLSFLLFVVWAVVLWLPLLLGRSRRLPLVVFLFLEAAALIVTGMLFFAYGNG